MNIQINKENRLLLAVDSKGNLVIPSLATEDLLYIINTLIDKVLCQ